jgi:hypothetical protein
MKPHLENLQTGKENIMPLVLVDPPKSETAAQKPDAVFFSYTREELAEAFAKVKNRKDWRKPIRAKIKAKDFDAASAAVAFFAGCELEVVENLGDEYKVAAAGYYSAIGS